MSDVPAADPSGGEARPDSRRPNYAARRMLVSTIGITAVVAAGVLGWRVIKGSDGSSPGAGAEWDAIALVDRATGAVTVIGDDGTPDDSAEGYTGRGRVTSVEVVGDRLVLIGTDQLVLTDLNAEPVIVPFERDASITRLATTEGLHLMIGDPQGGNVVIVEGDTGTTLDVGELANQSNPLLFADTARHDLDGTVFAVADAGNFQTIAVRSGSEDPVFYPDQPLAVGEELVATSQVVGTRVDIGLFDAEGERIGETPSEIPAGGAIVDGQLVFISIDGGVFRVRPGADEAERIGTVPVPGGGTVRGVRLSNGGDRLVVFGDVFQAVVGLEGNTLFTTTFSAAASITAPDPRWACLPVGSRDSAHSIVALDDGTQLADLAELEVSGTSADGCVVIGERSGVTEVISADGSVQLGRLRSATLSPDGRTVVALTTTGQLELIEIADDMTIGDPIDLSDVAPANPLVAFLDR